MMKMKLRKIMMPVKAINENMNYIILYLDYKKTKDIALLASVYAKVCAEKLDRRVFYDGVIFDEASFLKDIARSGTLPFVVFAKGSETRSGETKGNEIRGNSETKGSKEPVAFFWINSIEGKSCRAHVVFFKKVWGRKTSTPLGAFIYDYLLGLKDEQGYFFDVIIGITPKSNALAKEGAILAGAELVGIIPKFAWIAEKGKSEDAFLVVKCRKNEE